MSCKISQGCVLTLSAPLAISRDDLDRGLGIVEQAVVNVSMSARVSEK